MGQMDMQPILTITVPIIKIKGAARECYGDGDEVVRCEQTFKMGNLECDVPPPPLPPAFQSGKASGINLPLPLGLFIT